MLIPGEHISKTCFLLTVLLACAIFYAEANDKQINFKLGFDLTEGENGGPSLRVREFEDSKELNLNVRAEEKSGESKKPAARADSVSAETSDDSSDKKNREISNEEAAKPAVGSDESRDDEDDEENSNESRASVKLSTKGPGDYDPKPGVDARIHDQDLDSSEDRRRKREAGTFGHLKRKSKKFFAAEKQEASW